MRRGIRNIRLYLVRTCEEILKSASEPNCLALPMGGICFVYVAPECLDCSPPAFLWLRMISLHHARPQVRTDELCSHGPARKVASLLSSKVRMHGNNSGKLETRNSIALASFFCWFWLMFVASWRIDDDYVLQKYALKDCLASRVMAAIGHQSATIPSHNLDNHSSRTFNPSN